MARTIKRQPFEVSTSNKSYVRPQTLIQAEFKGLSNIKNDILADPMSFASTENIYVDDNMLLVSRPPFKFYGQEGYIERQWQFGPYQFRLYKKDGLNYSTYAYTFSCVSHTITVPEDLDSDEFKKDWLWLLPKDVELEICCVQIEDKIFIWFGGFDLIVFNTSKLYFESGIKYLYLPILSLVINGIETPLESENFLTSTGYRRHQYSALSSVNFELLLGKRVKVGLSGAITQDKSKYLYDTTIKTSEPILIYPFASIGSGYHVDIAYSTNGTVYLRYNEVTGSIAVSFDGRYFETLPAITGMGNIVGLPRLTRDGTHVVVFTRYGLAWCKLFADESTESAISFSFVWEFGPKGKYYSGDFESRDQFVCIGIVNAKPVIYAKYQNGTHGTVEAIHELHSILSNVREEFKIAHVYVPPKSSDTSSVATLKIAVFGRNMTDPIASKQISVGIGLFTLSENTLDMGFCDISDVVDEHSNYSFVDLATLVHKCDIKLTTDNDEFSIKTVFAALLSDTNGKRSIHDCRVLIGIGNGYGRFDMFSEQSNIFKLSADTMDFITDKYSYHNEIVAWPSLRSGELRNNATITITRDSLSWTGNIHRIFPNTLSLLDGQIVSGDFVVWKTGATALDEYLSPDIVADGYGQRIHLFKIERIDTETNSPTTGPIRNGDFVRLKAYENSITLQEDDPGNNTGGPIVISPWRYPPAPENWTYGDDWPTTWSTDLYPKPRTWKPGQALPIGTVEFTGVVTTSTQIIPLHMDNSVSLSIDGTIWTSALSTDNALELDELMNTKYVRNASDITDEIEARLFVPTHHNALVSHYFSFEANGKHLLEVMQIKRDENQLFDEDNSDVLLYLPKYNEQVFADKITNLHPIADNILSVFTGQSIWNITVSTLENGTMVYSAPVLSKIPAGCREGDDVMTALDGQALLLATSRGIAALAPQDFVATADNVITYLSDPIQDIYYRFYKDKVISSVTTDYDSHIKMLSYRYWLLFYRYMDREILVLDTRTNAWWVWSTPYPIKQIIDDIHLHLIMQIDASQESFGGVFYVWKDHEDTVFTGTPNPLFKLPASVKSLAGYCDDVIEKTFNGLYTRVYDNGTAEGRAVKQYASPTINWHFLSQKLHFNQINNYKAIKGITITLKGDDTIEAVLSTKTYRSVYHPEQSDVVEVPINEVRTFTHHLHLMHAIKFQYEFENDAMSEEPIPLRLGSLSIKYEIKEGIR